MKTLLISTDFSKHAKHTAEYGYNLARQIKANIVLCNAVIVPAEAPQAGLVVWPMEESGELLYDSARELTHLKEHLEQANHTSYFQPVIRCINGPGILTDVINHIIANHEIGLVIIGTHGNNGLSTFLLDNHSQNMINDTTKPLLLVPPTAVIAPIKKIAFATDFKRPDHDQEAIYALIPLAKALNAEILLTHIDDEKDLSHQLKQRAEQLMIELSDKADYPNIYYRVVKNASAEKGLEWLCEHGQIDMLAMLHRPHSFFDNLLRGSHTQKMASHIAIPFLVIHAGSK
jgi:nucleotide-binding universal stress UspA family protein